jgi:chromosome segregation ATPase
MQQSKKSVTARVPQDLYDKCNQHYGNMTDAVIAGLELLCNTKCNTDVIAIGEFNAQIEERDSKIRELQDLNDSLIKEFENNKEPAKILELQNIRIQDLQEQLRVKDVLQETRINDMHERIKLTDSYQQNRINDLKAQIQNLEDQLKIKDEQLDKRDSEIKNLTTITESQIRSFKMIGTKKPFWKFW